MKNLIKKYLPSRSLYYLTYLSNWNHNLYSINNKISFKTNLSDFFVWSKNCSKIEFIGKSKIIDNWWKEEVFITLVLFWRWEINLSSKYNSNNFEKITKPIKQESNYFSLRISLNQKYHWRIYWINI